MEDRKIREDAEVLAEEIIHQVAYHLRHKQSLWPKGDDLLDMKRIVKSLIVQHLLRRSTDGFSNGARDSAGTQKE